MAAPELVAEDNDASASRRIFGGQEHAADRRRRADELEEARAHRTGVDVLGSGAGRQRELAAPVGRHAVEQPRVALPVVEVCGRHREAPDPRERALWRQVEQPHEAIRLRVRQRAQQHGVDDAEDRGVDADAEREDDDDCDGERRRVRQRSEGVAHVGQNHRHVGIPRSGRREPDRVMSRRPRRAADRLAPEPSARCGRRCGRACVKLFIEVAEHEFQPVAGQAAFQQPHRERGRGHYFAPSLASSPPAIAVIARYACRNAASPEGRSA